MARFRKKLSRKASKRMFSKHARKTHRRNVDFNSRGGRVIT